MLVNLEFYGHRQLLLKAHAVAGQIQDELDPLDTQTSVLNGIDMEISKRQVVRILTSRLEDFVAEDRAVLRTGLATVPFISVDDTGAGHARRDGITTQIGGDRFTVFQTGRSKSQLNFLSLLRAGGEYYVINDAALEYMRCRKVAPEVVATCMLGRPDRRYAPVSATGWNSTTSADRTRPLAADRRQWSTHWQ